MHFKKKINPIFERGLVFHLFCHLNFQKSNENIFFFPKRHDISVTVCYKYMTCIGKPASLFNIHKMQHLSDRKTPQAFELWFNSIYGLVIIQT